MSVPEVRPKMVFFPENSCTLFMAILKPVVMCDVSSKKGLPTNILKKCSFVRYFKITWVRLVSSFQIVACLAIFCIIYKFSCIQMTFLRGVLL